MKKYIVTLLLSLLVALVVVTLNKAVAKAATRQSSIASSMATIAPPTRNILPTIGMGPGPVPCPPSCLRLQGK